MPQSQQIKKGDINDQNSGSDYLTGHGRVGKILLEICEQKLTFASSDITKGSLQKLPSGFCPLRGYPPYPLNGKSFCQKTLSGKGGYTPSPLTENCQKNSKKNW